MHAQSHHQTTAQGQQMPLSVVARAQELLREAEVSAGSTAAAAAAAATRSGTAPHQASLLKADTLVRIVADVEPDALTPLEALQRLYELRAEARRQLGVEG